ncbi:hypothetical protein UlMin_029791 [Ulmus minor]
MYLNMDKFNSSLATSSFQMSVSLGSNERRVRHQHSQTMDRSTIIKLEMLGSDEASRSDSKKALSAAKLVELALIDLKRAKRYHFFKAMKSLLN